ncbi:hypothetical protein C9374_000219 [Naegleria lovaniensis]|uniref:RGS domain-containing protein n=1 Tax=Naegleria lovaniensis TaxID=51637 RepID=A0AA88KMB4_NAELO|nr:uncharacterized protein C9374_000219 [Naegleria lovaniensis]KAG2388780.1 hypothetical protein C9374_000219 [Naegleria lovaniensis]
MNNNNYNQTNNNNGTSLPPCPDWVLALPQVPHVANVTSTCPDVISVPILPALFLCFYLVILVLSILGLAWKRKNGFIVFRTMSGMVVTIIFSVCIELLLAFRYILGRELYPCLLLSIIFFTMPTCVAMPSILRSLRLYVQYKVNLYKANRFQELPAMDDLTDCPSPVASELPGYNNSHSNKVSSVSSPSNTPRNIDPTSPTTPKFHDTEFEKESIPSSPSSVINFPSVGTSTQGYPLEINSNVRDYFSNYKLHTVSEKLFFKAHSLLSSHLFLISLLFGLFSFHIVQWFVVAVIEDAFYADRRFLMVDRSMLSLRGCYGTTVPAIISVLIYVGYLMVEIVCTVLLFRTDRDTWFIRGETILLLASQLFFIGIYVIITLIPFMKNVMEHVIPQGLVIMALASVELFVSIFCPVMYAIMKDSKSTMNLYESELEMILNNKETFELLLDFARRSFCTEGILVYKEIEQYKKSRNKKRKKKALDIVHCYITEGSPYQLNVPNIDIMREEILFKIHTLERDNLPPSLFDSLQVMAMVDLLDVYTRLKRSNARVRQIVEEWKLATSNQPPLN